MHCAEHFAAPKHFLPQVVESELKLWLPVEVQIPWSCASMQASTDDPAMGADSSLGAAWLAARTGLFSSTAERAMVTGFWSPLQVVNAGLQEPAMQDLQAGESPLVQHLVRQFVTVQEIRLPMHVAQAGV